MPSWNPPKSVLHRGLNALTLKLTKQISRRKEWLTWTSSAAYSRPLLEGTVRNIHRCRSALCQRAALLPKLCVPAQLPQSTWMWPITEVNIIKSKVGYTNKRDSKRKTWCRRTYICTKTAAVLMSTGMQYTKSQNHQQFKSACLFGTRSRKISSTFPPTWDCITTEPKGLANVAEDLITKPCQQQWHYKGMGWKQWGKKELT